MTPLMSCANSGNKEMAEWLVTRGADVNATMHTGWTAMHAAAKQGHADILKMLLDKGGNRNLTATHREFGRNLTLEDVATEQQIQDLLREY